MGASITPTSFADIYPHIIQTHILPRLDGPSLSTAAAASSYLQTLCADESLWSDICKSTWPSVTDPRVDDVISTFPAGYRSFFEDSFPALITDIDHRNRRRSWSDSQPDCSSSNPDRSSHPWPAELISAVDIRYKNDIIYSTFKFTDTTTDFLSPALRIELNCDPANNGSGSQPVPAISRSIDLNVDELAGAEDATISHLKESVTLNWILIYPTRKRACNLSSIKPVIARQDWMTNETLLRYVTVLPGCDPNEMVQCRIQVMLAVGKGGVGLHVREVMLQLQDMDCNCLTGREFLVITQGAILEENNVKRRKVVGDDEWERRYEEFKEMRREKMELVEKEEKKRELAITVNYIGILVSFFLSVYFLILLL